MEPPVFVAGSTLGSRRRHPPDHAPGTGMVGPRQNTALLQQSGISLLMPVSRAHAMPFGAAIGPSGDVRFRLWSPSEDRVSVIVEGRRSGGDGGSARRLTGLSLTETGAGTRYRFPLDDGTAVPDPASRYQPDDVHGASEVIDPLAYGGGTTAGAAGRGRKRFSTRCMSAPSRQRGPSGPRSAGWTISRPSVLTAIELMPVADSRGAQLGLRRMIFSRPRPATARRTTSRRWSTRPTAAG